MKKIDLYELVKQMVGPITPYGSTSIDDDRLDNLQEFIQLVDKLLADLEEVAEFKDNKQISMSVIGRTADNFLRDVATNYEGRKWEE